MSRRSSETLDPRVVADEIPTGVISQDIEKSPKPEDTTQVKEDADSPYKVELSPEDDPKNLTTFRKWLIVAIISTSALCVTCASSVVSSLASLRLLRAELIVFLLGCVHGGRDLSRLSCQCRGFHPRGQPIRPGSWSVDHSAGIVGCPISFSLDTIGLGPLLVGPLSEMYGRSIIYRASFVCFFAFTWPVAFPPHIGEFDPTLRSQNPRLIGLL